ncbi:helix-turn-helix transcriptional regulator [Marinobacter alexandrii]|uniref:helix-turn-helix transcriptional regulator n=3 Tax=Marinobacter alexandrii TaxID=2570351 RepID=UPI0032660FEB
MSGLESPKASPLTSESPFLANDAELIQSLYQALDNDTGFHDYLSLLVESVNGCAAQLVFVRKSPLRIEHIWYAGLSDEFIGWYLDNNMIASDAVTNHAIGQPPGTFQSALPLIEDGSPGDDYERWESDQSMLDSAWLVVEASDTHITLQTVQRTVAQGPYRPEELAAMDRLVPFIRQAVSLANNLHQPPSSVQALSAVIDLVPDAGFVLDNPGAVMVSNERGRRLLKQEQVISLRQRRFEFDDKKIQSAFFRISSRVVQADVQGHDYAPETLIVSRPGASSLLMTLQPLKRNELVTGAVLVTVTDSAWRVFPDAVMIQDYFSLSRSEAQLCEDLVTGMSLKDIAARRHKSEATLRSYLKQVFLKTGQSRQGQLISTILSALMR